MCYRKQEDNHRRFDLEHPAVSLRVRKAQPAGCAELLFHLHERAAGHLHG